MSNPTIIDRWKSYGPQTLSLLRIVASIMFITNGTMKLFAYPMGMPPDGSTANLLTEVGLAGILEFAGGLLMLFGLYTRPVAFILSGEMAVAYFQAHSPQGFWPLMNGGTDAILYCFIFLYFSANGPGSWSIDEMRGKRSADIRTT